MTVKYNFKFDINFYKVVINTNGKINKKIYIDKIFKPIIKL